MKLLFYFFVFILFISCSFADDYNSSSIISDIINKSEKLFKKNEDSIVVKLNLYTHNINYRIGHFKNLTLDFNESFDSVTYLILTKRYTKKIMIDTGYISCDNPYLFCKTDETNKDNIICIEPPLYGGWSTINMIWNNFYLKLGFEEYLNYSSNIYIPVYIVNKNGAIHEYIYVYKIKLDKAINFCYIKRITL